MKRFRLNPSLTSPTSALFVLYVQPDGYTVDSLAGGKKKKKRTAESQIESQRAAFPQWTPVGWNLFIREIPEWLHGFENRHQTLNT